MSSWKQYGGINNYERSGRINADSISVNKFVFKEAYVGHFDICGDFHLTGNATFDNSIYVNNITVLHGDAFLQGNTTIGSNVTNTNLDIYSNSTFYGTANFANDFVVQGNIGVKKCEYFK
jgi:hypothetical protein